MELALTVPLLPSQIDAANRLHQQLEQWQIIDQALGSLHARFPGFDLEATLLKVAAMNQLYGTKVYAVVRMAQHITAIMPGAYEQDVPELVEALASLSDGRKYLSFASKFAHFFIDMERFPIYDSFARKMVAYHLGKQRQVPETEGAYKAFLENIERVKRRAHLSCTNKELDHYLWLAGLYQTWKKKHEAKMNVEVAKLFTTPSPDESNDLALLLPET